MSRARSTSDATDPNINVARILVLGAATFDTPPSNRDGGRGWSAAWYRRPREEVQRNVTA